MECMTRVPLTQDNGNSEVARSRDRRGPALPMMSDGHVTAAAAKSGDVVSPVQTGATLSSGCERRRPDLVEDREQLVELRRREEPIRTSWREVGEWRFVEQ